MLTRNEILTKVENGKIIAVVRLADRSKAEKMTEALLRGGVINVEITMTSEKPFDIMESLKKNFGDVCNIGAGSVLNAETAEKCIQAGAEFIVSPVSKEEIALMSHKYDKPAILGAYTPSEILSCWEWGADLVKIFPATKLGPEFFKDIHGPMPQIRMAPTGGIDLSNAKAFLDAGAVCLGVGSSLIKKSLIEQNDWAALSALAQDFMNAIQ